MFLGAWSILGVWKWSVRLRDCVSHEKKVKGVEAAILPFSRWVDGVKKACKRAPWNSVMKRLISQVEGSKVKLIC